jgi:hypothetical protein
MSADSMARDPEHWTDHIKASANQAEAPIEGAH